MTEEQWAIVVLGVLVVLLAGFSVLVVVVSGTERDVRRSQRSFLAALEASNINRGLVEERVVGVKAELGGYKKEMERVAKFADIEFREITAIFSRIEEAKKALKPEGGVFLVEENKPYFRKVLEVSGHLSNAAKSLVLAECAALDGIDNGASE